MSKTRSFGVQKNNEIQDNVSSIDRSFIRGLDRTRAIRVEQREKLIKIVEKSDLPSISIRILFDYDSDRIRRGSFESLNEIGDALHNVALVESIIMLNGHTDAVGSRACNQNLSVRRAISAKRYLTEIMQVPHERLVVAGFGEDRLNDPDDPANESNRRVEIINLGE
ncbi:MAG: OmpA family protein [Hyphomicrobiales bacterium]|nr:OmpA family protein [Hyphomicrobiales bacterium]